MKRNDFVIASIPLLAGFSTTLLVACQHTPQASAFASTPADKAAEQRLRPVDTMPPLQPFDEQFVVMPAPAER
jgi:hypothetical protein